MSCQAFVAETRNSYPRAAGTRLGYFSSNQEKLFNKNKNNHNDNQNQNQNDKLSSSSSSSSSSSLRTNQLMFDQQKKNQEIAREWEAEIQASTIEKSDMQRVQQWLRDSSSRKPQTSSDGWKVALASATVCGLASEWFTDSTVFSVVAFVAVFIAALRDPLDEEDEAVAGAVARIIGRSALKSYQESQPKLKAVARAAVQGDEPWTQMQVELQELRQENLELRQYKERREWIDDEQSNYNLEELKVLAQRSQVIYSGVTKSQLMMRLLQVGALRIKKY